VFLAALLAVAGAEAADQAPARAKAEGNWLGLIAGPAGASETVFAADMASLFPPSGGLRVLPMLGDAGAGNIEALLDDPHVDMAFGGTEALAAAEAKDKRLAEKLELVAKLSPQEVHVLARGEIASLADLAGRQVSFGPPGSASAATAGALFKALGLSIEAVNLDEAVAIERLKQGTLSAAVIVGGKPSPLIAAVPPTAGLRLLSIPFGAQLEANYLPTELGPDDYSNLIQPGGDVATVATGMVLLAARAKNDPGSGERIGHFVGTAFSSFAGLKAEGRHPKWREVNLAASEPGLTRSRAAEAWLAAHNEAEVRPATKPIAASANAAAGPDLAEGLMSTEQKEALFKRFLEWKRGKAR
jgi:TRAP transporter TAXI family solute receptor